MNKTEAAYDAHLSLLLRAGEILWYGFERVKLRLADKTFFTVDFFIVAKDGTLEAHDVKGFMEDDAAVKIKTAADLFPFRFFIVKHKAGAWNVEEV